MNSNNLSLFKTLFLIKGILSIFGFLFGVGYAAFGMVMGTVFSIFGEAIQDAASENTEIPIFNPGYIFLIIGGGVALLFATASVLNFLASSYIGKHVKYQFIFVVSILNCLTGILGILLGVFAIIELQKPEVKALFEEAEMKEGVLDNQISG